MVLKKTPRRKTVTGKGSPVKRSRSRPYEVKTLILRGLASSTLGRNTCSTPSLYSARIFSVSTLTGSVKERVNAPKKRSVR